MGVASRRAIGRTAAMLASLSLAGGGAAQAGEVSINGVPIGAFEPGVGGLEGQVFVKCSSVTLESGGHLRIVCPGYNLSAESGAPPAPARGSGGTAASSGRGNDSTPKGGSTASVASGGGASARPGAREGSASTEKKPATGSPASAPARTAPAPVVARPPEPVAPVDNSPRTSARYWLVSERSPEGAPPVDVLLYINTKLVRHFKAGDPVVVEEISRYLKPGVNKVLFSPDASAGGGGGAAGKYLRLTIGAAADPSELGDPAIEFRVEGDTEEPEMLMGEIVAP